MGGGHYNGDVATRSRSTTRDVFEWAETQRAAPIAERKCHPTLNPKNAMRESCETSEHPDVTSAILWFDLTRSRGEDTRLVFDRTPPMIGQFYLRQYGKRLVVCPAGFGNAKADRFWMQVGQFEADNRLDTHLTNIYAEKGGGGDGRESSEAAAYFTARHTKLDSLKRGKKGICVFMTDASFHPHVDPDEIQKMIGDKLSGPIDSKCIFAELQRMYHTFVIYPRAGWEERKADIDEEIRQRVQQAGGMVSGVDMQFSLIWNNYNDLDLHVVTPRGAHIFYGNKVAPCGGNLDVDMNVGGETNKPAEHTRWERGKAERGTYKVYVQNFSTHRGCAAKTPFKVEIEINGKISHFEGETPAGKIHSDSDTLVGEFFYDPAERVSDSEVASQADLRYAGFHDEKILRDWRSVLPAENVLQVQDPRACVDVITGLIALTEGTRTLPAYLEDLDKHKQQTPERIADVKQALTAYAERVGAPVVSASAFSAAPGDFHKPKAVAKKSAGSKRL